MARPGLGGLEGGVLVVESPVSRFRVFGGFLAIRAGRDSVHFFYRPVFIGYWVEKHDVLGAGLIAFGFITSIVSYAFGDRLGMRDLLVGIISGLFLFIGVLMIILGIYYLLKRKRYIVIESAAGLRVLFPGGLTDKDINIIIKQLKTNLEEKTQETSIL